MSQHAVTKSCPCGSGRPLAACCGVYLDNQQDPPTAEALMRSRYTAFVLRNADYLRKTWDPAQRPRSLNLESDKTDWLGLEILRTEAGGEANDEGRVEFIARFRLAGREQALHEDSRFRRQDGRWLYIDGETQVRSSAAPAPATVATAAVGRNDPCPCGSGQKFKRCCGR
jgi:SEC-C motif-containing protein